MFISLGVFDCQCSQIVFGFAAVFASFILDSLDEPFRQIYFLHFLFCIFLVRCWRVKWSSHWEEGPSIFKAVNVFTYNWKLVVACGGYASEYNWCRRLYWTAMTVPLPSFLPRFTGLQELRQQCNELTPQVVDALICIFILYITLVDTVVRISVNQL